MELKPKGKQNVLEYVYELTINFTKGNLGDAEAKRYSLFFFTVFTFLLVANNLGLMTKLETAEGHNLWTSPTANMAYDFGLATIATVFCHVEGIRRRGFKAYPQIFCDTLGYGSNEHFGRSDQPCVACSSSVR